MTRKSIEIGRALLFTAATLTAPLAAKAATPNEPCPAGEMKVAQISGEFLYRANSIYFRRAIPVSQRNPVRNDFWNHDGRPLGSVIITDGQMTKIDKNGKSSKPEPIRGTVDPRQVIFGDAYKEFVLFGPPTESTACLPGAIFETKKSPFSDPVTLGLASGSPSRTAHITPGFNR